MKLSQILSNFKVYSNPATNPGKNGLIYVNLTGYVIPEVWEYMASKIYRFQEESKPARVLRYESGCTNTMCDICYKDAE